MTALSGWMTNSNTTTCPFRMPQESNEEPDQAGVMEQGPESHPEQEKNAAGVVEEQLTLTTRLLTSPVWLA